MDGEVQSYVEPIKFLGKGAKKFFFFFLVVIASRTIFSYFFSMQVTQLVRKKSD